jgi:hypothetical protein
MIQQYVCKRNGKQIEGGKCGGEEKDRRRREGKKKPTNVTLSSASNSNTEVDAMQ